jgi:hypothetical protein
MEATLFIKQNKALLGIGMLVSLLRVFSVFAQPEAEPNNDCNTANQITSFGTYTTSMA